MSRKRSLKHRYLRFLRRIWPAPTLAALGLLLGACASSSTASASVQASEARSLQATTVEHPPTGNDVELRHDWDPQLFPTELHLAPEFRNACAPIISLPPTIVLDGKEEVVDALEPIASCLTLGPVAGERLHLFGSSHLPGHWDAPVEAGGRADQLRTNLSLLGVPFNELVTHDVDNGRGVELTTTPGAS